MSRVFSPASFLAVAHQLVSAVDDAPLASREIVVARVRTALGRSYYAVYLLVRAEISRRHGIEHRRLPHGAVYTRLQSPRASDDVRQLGRALEWMYTLRQKADYEMDPGPAWREHLEDVAAAEALVLNARVLADMIPRLDFAPVVPLF